ACKKKIPTLDHAPFRHPGPYFIVSKDATVISMLAPEMTLKYRDDFDQLKKIALLPPEILSGSRAKCVLAEAIFENTKRLTHQNARHVLAGLRQTFSDADLLDTENAHSGFALIHEISVVAKGFCAHTPESLLFRLKTGLDALPK